VYLEQINHYKEEYDIEIELVKGKKKKNEQILLYYLTFYNIRK